MQFQYPVGVHTEHTTFLNDTKCSVFKNTPHLMGIFNHTYSIGKVMVPHTANLMENAMYYSTNLLMLNSRSQSPYSISLLPVISSVVIIRGRPCIPVLIILSLFCPSGIPGATSSRICLALFSRPWIDPQKLQNRDSQAQLLPCPTRFPSLEATVDNPLRE